MTIIIVGFVVMSVLAMRTVRYFGLERWHVSTALLLLGAALYVVNALLIHHYIRSRARFFATDDRWEFTAGLGIVPRWVSVIGLLAISAVAAALVPWIVVGIRVFF